ncbi:hypothetical protein JR316_0001380 [Psilocybe cubensis]|uniref:Uncharacterized protein n=2 Tax=Psilocybe cubensis TaxID=181762 RepID=A0ACB8HGZ9_PSICU|nr:hypothetical protein JR316_0001380 [Psilocybe cubensis]KAH9487308.1 hypothetical protein JR316_0001380 [Psilocybe cubensis]
MHTQYAVPPHHNYYSSQTFYHEAYLSSNDAQNIANFSRGSSLAYQQNYPYLLDRGEHSRLCTSGLVDSTADATGLGFAGNSLVTTGAFAGAEDIASYNQQPWDWSSAPEGETNASSSPIYASPSAEDAYFRISKTPADHESSLRSPAPQLPTPAAMAILLNPNGRSEAEPSQPGCQFPLPSELVANRSPATAKSNRLVEQVVASQEGIPESISREKKHACTMCHKRFDRPSTLRKHLLVHTGEKAFVCDICGRRFGVASNLNRHVKRCALKPVNTPSPSKSTADSPTDTMNSSIPNPSTPTTSSAESGAQGQELRRATRIHSSALTASRSSAHSMNPAHNSRVSGEIPSVRAPKHPTQKRRRRAPSPSQWVPITLQNLNLSSEDLHRATCVPLPPVRRNYPKEERDSWDENVGVSPYHPISWTGTLPGPGLGHGIGLGGKDLKNMEFGGRGGVILGRVLVC